MALSILYELREVIGSWGERKHNFWGGGLKKTIRCLLFKLKITSLFSTIVLQNYIQVCTVTSRSSLLLFISYFLSYPWNSSVFDYCLLPIQTHIFQAVFHFAILIQLCIFMSFTTISFPYFCNCQCFFGRFHHPFRYLQNLPIISVELISAFVIHLSRSPMQMLN